MYSRQEYFQCICERIVLISYKQKITLYSILSSLILPLPIFCFFIILAVFFFLLKKPTISKTLLILSTVWFILISTSLIPNFFVKQLEKRCEPLLDSLLPFTGTHWNILVLGGGHINDPRLSYNNQLSRNALGRLVEGIRIYRKLPGSKLIVSGYAGSQSITQAQVLERTAISLGVDSLDIIRLDTPSNTYKESLAYINTMGGKDSLILVTDAVHMPRALSLFQKIGIEPIGSPVNQMFKTCPEKNRRGWIPSSDNIYKMEYAMHEYIGMLWAYLRY